MMQVLLRMFQRNLVVNPPMQLRAVVLLTAILAYGTSGFLYFELPANPDLTWTDAPVVFDGDPHHRGLR